MRYPLRTFLKFAVIVGVLGGAALLAVATAGRAASTNICSTPSTGTPLSPASCVQELVVPHYISTGASAISLTKFTNQSGVGGATATHTVISVNFQTPVSVTAIALSVGGLPISATSCTPSPGSSSVTSVSCPVGNIAGGSTAKMTVEFSGATTTMTLTGAASYGEGCCNASNPPNDYQVNYDKLTVVTDGTASGDCFSTTTWNVNGKTSTQSTSASGGQGSGGFPCTFADAGVFPTVPAGYHTQVSFVEFPVMTGSPATVVIQFTPLPSGLNWKTFPLYENNGGANFVVPNCNLDGSVPSGSGFDSCIYNRSTLPKGGAEIDMHVTGSPIDGSYWG